ncbi:MAG: hypothetical protein AB9866_10515 [Syntrophobacteraceae bacterium]
MAESAAGALDCIRPEGLFILDNSDWYVGVAQLVREKGFFQVDFSGFDLINNNCWTTSEGPPKLSQKMALPGIRS